MQSIENICDIFNWQTIILDIYWKILKISDSLNSFPIFFWHSKVPRKYLICEDQDVYDII